ncbi:Calpain-2 catalytic subunit [Portunus trituberculatus]|uniref:Calpain-2 catalytic subunit n=1 Tax=Portunus trituberculatus TaxID=210409 RepID=A0A5B7CJV9_PORTR|nr:Calpain-2 catalytic subunit [Portunus trituberculatus]
MLLFFTGRFRFWHFGEWVEVIIDDRLPTFKGRLVYLHSTDPSEFWAALLEKAYAKFYGSYEALQKGFTTRALQDLTGGIVQSFSLTMQERFLTYQVLNSAVPRSTLLIASINLEKDNKRNLRLRNGLVTQHAYSVTGLARVRTKLGETPLVRMAFEDFARHFTHLDLVHVGPDDWMNEPALHSKKPWRAVLARRRWRGGYNAGGGTQHTETTAMNPQFHVQIPRAGLSKCHVVVSVTQQYDTFLSAQDTKRRHHLHPIGFAVYEIPPNMTRLTPAFVTEHTAFLKFDRSHSGKTSSYHLRPALWEAGVTVSNKVLECLVLRFAKNRILTSEAFLMALVRLHLAHERYHSIDTKMKGNPLSLEEPFSGKCEPVHVRVYVSSSGRGVLGAARLGKETIARKNRNQISLTETLTGCCFSGSWTINRRRQKRQQRVEFSDKVRTLPQLTPNGEVDKVVMLMRCDIRL